MISIVFVCSMMSNMCSMMHFRFINHNWIFIFGMLNINTHLLDPDNLSFWAIIGHHKFHEIITNTEKIYN